MSTPLYLDATMAAFVLLPLAAGVVVGRMTAHIDTWAARHGRRAVMRHTNWLLIMMLVYLLLMEGSEPSLIQAIADSLYCPH